MIEFYTPTARERLMRYFKKNPRASDETDEHFLTRARGQEALSDRQIAAAERAALQERASDFAYRLFTTPGRMGCFERRERFTRGMARTGDQVCRTPTA